MSNLQQYPLKLLLLIKLQRSLCENLLKSALIAVKPSVRCVQCELNTADYLLVFLKITEYFTLKV